MSSGLSSGVSGLALGTGLYRDVSGLWGGASGLISGFGFSPALLFAQGEPGGWYDPSDLSTMFRDSAGTTPVTATGQTVGLVLDKSQGLVLGPEQLSVGFAVTQAGAPAAAYNTVTGQGSVSRVSSSVRSYVRFNLTSTSFYRLTIQNTGGGSLDVSALVGGGSVASGQTVTMFTSGASSPTIFASTDGTTVTFTVVSIKELPGNHLTQANLANRAIYGIEPFGGRRNLLSWTEEFDNAYWTKIGVTTAVHSGSEWNVTEDTSTGAHTVRPFGQTFVGGVAYSWSVEAKLISGSRNVRFGSNNTGIIAPTTVFNISNGTIVSTASGVVATITPLGDGWYRLTATVTALSSGSTQALIMQLASGTSTSYAGDGTSTVRFRKPQVETGSTATAYQAVTDQWNVTEAGVPSVSYVQFDGSDDFYISPTITPGIDKAQVFAGVRKLSDATAGTVAETSSSAANNAGSLAVFAPQSPAPNYNFRTGGSISIFGPAPSGFAAPITNILTALGDIAGDLATLRINGTQAASSTADQGTGNYLAYPLYVGRRGGTTLPFNGRLYQLIVRFGANLPLETIQQTEAWVNGKTGAY